MKKQTKLKILLVYMLLYIGIICYLSEPKYIDYADRIPHKYDWVSIPYLYTGNQVVTGIVLQVNNKSFLAKVSKFGYSEYYQIDNKNPDYKVVGTGTIYHKINDFVGFNIMLLTEVFIAILCIILIQMIVDTHNNNQK